MVFSEVYGSYFNVVAQILALATEDNLSFKDINRIISEKAFGESALNISAALKNNDWKLITPNLKTPLKHRPKMPLTALQKQWLKAICNDPRIKLFNPSTNGLENVEPLYDRSTLVYFVRYSDGDDFEDEEYIRNFRVILRAFEECRKLEVRYTGHRGHIIHEVCIPHKLEYSSKDDKFRLIAAPDGTGKHALTVNLSRLQSVRMLGRFSADKYVPPVSDLRELVVDLVDERNCLERFMLHFSHLEKQAEKTDALHYRIIIKYDKDDETEILIRILSFGPMVKVVSPQSFMELIKERVDKQAGCEV